MTEIENRLINYNYIRKLAVFLKKENLEELFTALVLTERYALMDDIKVLTNKEILDAHKKYGLYLKSREPMINKKFL